MSEVVGSSPTGSTSTDAEVAPRGRRPRVPQPLRLVHATRRRRRRDPDQSPRPSVRAPRPGAPPATDRRRRRMIEACPPIDSLPPRSSSWTSSRASAPSGLSMASTSAFPRARSPCCSARPGPERRSRSSTSSGSYSRLGRGGDRRRQEPRRADGNRALRLRRGISAVLQGTLLFTCGLFYSLNVYENVAFALRARTRLSPEQVDQVTLDHLEMVGMRERADAMPDQLSAGMWEARRRLRERSRSRRAW